MFENESHNNPAELHHYQENEKTVHLELHKAKALFVICNQLIEKKVKVHVATQKNHIEHSQKYSTNTFIYRLRPKKARTGRLLNDYGNEVVKNQEGVSDHGKQQHLFKKVSLTAFYCSLRVSKHLIYPAPLRKHCESHSAKQELSEIMFQGKQLFVSLTICRWSVDCTEQQFG